MPRSEAQALEPPSNRDNVVAFDHEESHVLLDGDVARDGLREQVTRLCTMEREMLFSFSFNIQRGLEQTGGGGAARARREASLEGVGITTVLAYFGPRNALGSCVLDVDRQMAGL